jgi:hypothetical protein
LGVCFEPENEESFLTAINQLRNKMNIGTDNATKEVKTLIDRKELAGQMLEFIRI